MLKSLAPSLVGAVLVSASALSSAQTAVPSPAPASFFERYEARVSAIQSVQPRWIVPVVSPYPMLIQVFRADFTRQISPTHSTTWNLGASRGLNLIPFKNTEIDVLVPPFLEHDTRAADGFGDFSVTGKYRFFSANEKHGNYVLTGQVTAAVPTGSYANGAADAVITPSLSGGKGFGKFDGFVSVGGSLPTADQKLIGRSLVSNAVTQYHVSKYLWPEVEFNTTAFYGGSKDGKVQTFITPGLMLGKFAAHPRAEKSRLGFAAGVGFQDAATHYHAYNHSLIFTGRIIF